MGFIRYRESKQWGKHNTIMFKKSLRKQEALPMPVFKVPESLQKLGVEIHNPNVPGFFNKPIGYVPELNHNMFRKPTLADHPLYKPDKTYTIDGTRSFADGMDQACALINALKVKPFPDEIINADKIEWPSDIEELVVDSIMAGERYDPTLELLPKKHDPILFWIIQYKQHGVPSIKKNNVILNTLYRRIYQYAFNQGFLQENRCDYNSPFSSFLPADLFGAKMPLVIRHQPYMTIQSMNPVPRLASKAEVGASRGQQPPNIYPISPLIDLKTDNIYNTETIMPRSQIHGLHMNTLLFSKTQNQKYPFTTDELAANAIVFCFGAALAQIHRFGDKLNLIENPVVTKAAQLVNGRIDLVALQLNTLQLNDSEGVKNMVWAEKGLPFYYAKSEYENLEKVEDLDMSTFRKFANLLLY